MSFRSINFFNLDCEPCYCWAYSCIFWMAAFNLF